MFIFSHMADFCKNVASHFVIGARIFSLFSVNETRIRDHGHTFYVYGHPIFLHFFTSMLQIVWTKRVGVGQMRWWNQRSGKYFGKPISHIHFFYRFVFNLFVALCAGGWKSIQPFWWPCFMFSAAHVEHGHGNIWVFHFMFQFLGVGQPVVQKTELAICWETCLAYVFCFIILYWICLCGCTPGVENHVFFVANLHVLSCSCWKWTWQHTGMTPHKSNTLMHGSGI